MRRSQKQTFEPNQSINFVLPTSAPNFIQDMRRCRSCTPFWEHQWFISQRKVMQLNRRLTQGWEKAGLNRLKGIIRPFKLTSIF